MRHRPFAIAGPQQVVWRRVLAPQRRAFERSPGGFPFFSHPRRDAWGSSPVLAISPPLARAPAQAARDDRLTAGLDVDLLVAAGWRRAVVGFFAGKLPSKN